MGNRIEELEQGINELKAEMGEGSPSPSVTPRVKSDDSKVEEDDIAEGSKWSL